MYSVNSSRAPRLAGDVERHREVRGRLVTQRVRQHRREAVDRVRRLARRGREILRGQREERPVRQGVPVHEHQAGGRRRLSARSSSMLSLPRPRSCHAPLTIRTVATATSPGAPPRPRVTRIDDVSDHRTSTRRHRAGTQLARRGAPWPRKPPTGDPVQDAPQVDRPKHAAAGLPAVAHTLRIAQQQMGVRRTALTLLKVNQKDGFDCPGCAWPEPATSGTPPSSARTAPRPSPRRPPCAASPPSSSPRTPSPTSPAAAATGWASRAGSPSRCTSPRAPTTTSRSPGSAPSTSSPRS